MAQNYSWPSSASVTVAAIGSNGATIPSQSILIGAEDPSGDLQPLQVDGSGDLLVTASALPLPTGAATEATLQLVLDELETQTPILTSMDDSLVSVDDTLVTVSNSLTDIQGTVGTVGITTVTKGLFVGGKNTDDDTFLPLFLNSGGQLITRSQSRAWVLDSSGDSVTAVIGGSVPLPTGAATAALQTSGNASLTSIDGKLGTLGQKAMSGSAPVVIASDQSALPVSQSGTWNITNISGTVSLPTGAATEATLSAMSAKLPATLGQKTSANSMAVVLPSDQIVATAAPTGRSRANAPVLNDYSSSPVTSAAYVQIIASTTSAANAIEIFDSSGVTLYLAVGAAASEVDQIIVIPGGNGLIPLAIPASSRISLKATSTSATSGIFTINLYT
jgi:hypothetical protein